MGRSDPLRETASGSACAYLCLFFFFQAEDGIRDGRVTGVQTCALPILVAAADGVVSFAGPVGGSLFVTVDHPDGYKSRSEERRVGKECRYRWWGEPYKKKEFK